MTGAWTRRSTITRLRSPSGRSTPRRSRPRRTRCSSRRSNCCRPEALSLLRTRAAERPARSARLASVQLRSRATRKSSHQSSSLALSLICRRYTSVIRVYLADTLPIVRVTNYWLEYIVITYYIVYACRLDPCSQWMQPSRCCKRSSLRLSRLSRALQLKVKPELYPYI